MFGGGRGIIQDRIVLCFAMTADHKEFISLPLASEESDECSTNDDQRKRNMEKKDRYKGGSRQRPHHFVLQRPVPDADNCGGNDCEYGWLQAVKDRCDPGHVSEGHIDIAEPPKNEDRRDDKESAGNNAAPRLVQKPTDIDCQLLSFRSGQKHAIIERMEEARFADPFLLLDQFGVHDRDLSSGPTKTDKSKL